MAKSKTTFFCKECGYESAKWLGQCPGCHAWNSFVEETVENRLPGMAAKTGKRTDAARPVSISEISLEEEIRTGTGLGELDRVLGGGIVQGSMILVGGDPGIGKSTLLLQVCRLVAGQGKDVFYISGEESLKQIKMRAERLGSFSEHMKLLCETNLDTIQDAVIAAKPDIVVIDSIQTMFREEISSAPGSVSQVRESTNLLLQIAKGMAITVFIVGHVTKEGVVAGPRVLEHMVDTVLYFEGDRYASYRVLRGVKNRFGATNEIGVFEMRQDGLREVPNPSAFMLQGRPEHASGSAVACVLEGSRPMMVEVQALMSHTNFAMPRRTATGFDFNRVNVLIAVLEKRLGLSLSDCDAYVNIVGGLRINDPSLDLAVITAIISSYKNTEVPDGLVVFGEVGLSGEIRGISQPEQRVMEAEKMGFRCCILPEVSKAQIVKKTAIRLIGVASVNELYRFMQG